MWIQKNVKVIFLDNKLTFSDKYSSCKRDLNFVDDLVFNLTVKSMNDELICLLDVFLFSIGI